MTFKIELVDSTQAELVRAIAIEAFAEYRDALEPPPGILFESVEDVVSHIKRGGAVVVGRGTPQWEPLAFVPSLAFSTLVGCPCYPHFAGGGSPRR